ncbi:MAG: helix-turn-helix domain-containing protein [Blastocatellia bacterium]
MTIIKLLPRQSAQLEEFLTTRPDARQLKRAQALLWLADGDSVEEVAARLRVTRQTIYNWVERFEARAGLPLNGRLADGIRLGRPPTALSIIDPLIDKVVEKDPREFGYRSTIWTAPLLQRYLEEKHQIAVSVSSIRLAIERLRMIWKRPRHRLALRAHNWRLAKGGSSEVSGRNRGRSS